MYKPQRAGRVSFAELLDAVAAVSPELRVRFTSPHPKEFSDEVLQVSLLGVVGQLYEGSPAALALAVKLACALSYRTGAMCCSAPVEMARWCSTGPAYSAHARRLLREDVKQHALFLCLLLLICINPPSIAVHRCCSGPAQGMAWSLAPHRQLRQQLTAHHAWHGPQLLRAGGSDFHLALKDAGSPRSVHVDRHTACRLPVPNPKRSHGQPG